MGEESVLKAFGASVTLFSGYLLLRFSPYRRLKAEHLRTDRFALHVLGFALFTYMLAVVIVSVLDRRYQGSFFSLYLHKAAEAYAHVEAPVLLSLAVAPLLGVLDSLMITVRMWVDPAVEQCSWKKPIAKINAAAHALFILQCDDAAVRLLHRATIFRKPLMVTLKSGKVYLGQPAQGIIDPSVRAHSIKIIPLMSGYRNSKTHKVEFPTRYRDLYRQIVPRQREKQTNPNDPLARDLADLLLDNGKKVETDLQDMGVVVLWSEVQSLSLYDENIYQAFQRQGPPAAKKKARAWVGKEGVLTKILSRLG